MYTSSPLERHASFVTTTPRHTSLRTMYGTRTRSTYEWSITTLESLCWQVTSRSCASGRRITRLTYWRNHSHGQNSNVSATISVYGSQVVQVRSEEESYSYIHSSFFFPFLFGLWFLCSDFCVPTTSLCVLVEEECRESGDSGCGHVMRYHNSRFGIRT